MDRPTADSRALKGVSHLVGPGVTWQTAAAPQRPVGPPPLQADQPRETHRKSRIPTSGSGWRLKDVFSRRWSRGQG